MKSIITIIAAMLFTAAGFAQTPQRAGQPQPEMKLDYTVHDFGKVKERGGVVSHTFAFTNTGSAALVVTGVNTACKCTEASFSTRPVQPGEGSQIVITYNPRRQKGQFFKAIQVQTNEPQNRRIITVQGEVVK